MESEAPLYSFVLFEQGFYPKTGIHFWETLLRRPARPSGSIGFPAPRARKIPRDISRGIADRRRRWRDAAAPRNDLWIVPSRYGPACSRPSRLRYICADAAIRGSSFGRPLPASASTLPRQVPAALAMAIRKDRLCCADNCSVNLPSAEGRCVPTRRPAYR